MIHLMLRALFRLIFELKLDTQTATDTAANIAVDIAAVTGRLPRKFLPSLSVSKRIDCGVPDGASDLSHIRSHQG
jgi:hypothetical protein